MRNDGPLALWLDPVVTPPIRHFSPVNALERLVISLIFVNATSMLCLAIRTKFVLQLLATRRFIQYFRDVLHTSELDVYILIVQYYEWS